MSSEMKLCSSVDGFNMYTETNPGGWKSIIMDSKNELVARFGKVATEMSTTEARNNGSLDYSGCVIYYSIESTVLRLICLKGRWYLTTGRNFNAFECGWGDEPNSFGDLFLDLLPYDAGMQDNRFDIFCAGLNQNYQYGFYLTTNHRTRHVSHLHIEDCELYLMGIFNLDGTEVARPEDFPFQYPSMIGTRDPNELYTLLDNMDPYVYQGITLVYPNSVIKIYTDEYFYMLNLRNNSPSLDMRYLELLIKSEATDNSDELDEFCLHFPEANDRYFIVNSMYEKMVAGMLDICARRETGILRVDHIQNGMWKGITTNGVKKSIVCTDIITYLATQQLEQVMKLIRSFKNG